MIRAQSQPTPYRTWFSDGEHQGISDTTADKGGQHSGFRPHDLLEAALATCVGMTVRMYADHHGIPLRGVTANVTLDRGPDEVVFRYEIELDGDLTAEQRDRLLRAAGACPVRQTLSKHIRFQCGAGANGGTIEGRSAG
jgi:putative redox protein